MDFIDFTLFDIFKKLDKIYINLSINDSVVPYKELIVKMNSKILLFNSQIVKDSNEPTLILIYNVPHSANIPDTLHFEVTYNNQTYKTISKEIVPLINKKKLALTTLFKDDFEHFPMFYKYYKEEGVEHFYMYYNGIIDNKIKELFNKKDVTLIEWDFRYWNCRHKYIHHAQLGQIHNFLYKYGKDSYEYTIFCDLDEYLHINNTTLRSYITNKNKIFYRFNNIWSDFIDRRIPNTFPRTFLVHKKKDTLSRSKTIYKLDKISVLGIHYCSTQISLEKKYKIIDLDMYHFYKISTKKRSYNTFKIITIKRGDLLYN